VFYRAKFIASVGGSTPTSVMLYFQSVLGDGWRK